MDKCIEHNNCIGRINDNINEIKVTNAKMQGKIDGFTESITEFVAFIRQDVYAKDGLMDRVGNHSNQLILQWGLLAIVVMAIIAMFLRTMFT